MPETGGSHDRSRSGRAARWAARARRHLPLVHFVLDAACWTFALPVAVWLRYDFDASHFNLGTIRAVALAIVLQGAFGLVVGLYRRRWRYGSFDEIAAISGAAFGTGVVLAVVLWFDTATPRSVPALALPFALLGQVALRATWRAWVDSRRRRRPDSAVRLVVVGAGEAAAQLIKTMHASIDSEYVPVALLDDDRTKRRLRLSGVQVVGTIDDLPEVAARFDASAVLVAIPTGDRTLFQRIDRLAREADLEVLVLPPIDRLLGPLGVGDIRPISPEDLLGRHVAEIDPVSIAGYVTGNRVLVTGAGGSIGSELCRQLGAFEPAELFLLDRDENGLHATQLSIDGRASLQSPPLVLADIRDAERIDAVMAELRPDIVFHAAALKHLPLLDASPDEGWKTNVVGTLNVLDAAVRHGVSRFVNVSTDKAANPSSVLGWTKRLTERLTADAGRRTSMHCVSVRFGNVLGSAGSVLTVFEAQARAGVPITVTDERMTRYFMTVGEAARLVIQAGAIGDSGEVLILDMGQPVRIRDVAQRYAERAHPPLDVVVTGLRGNEKLHEELFADGERGERRRHELISHVEVVPLRREVVLACELPSDQPAIARIALAEVDAMSDRS